MVAVMEVSDIPVLPIAKIEAFLGQLKTQHGKVEAARNSKRQIEGSVGNMQVVYKDSYSKRSVDEICSRAIMDVMQEARDAALAKAETIERAERLNAALLADNLRRDLCNEAARLSVALGVYAKEISQ